MSASPRAEAVARQGFDVRGDVGQKRAKATKADKTMAQEYRALNASAKKAYRHEWAERKLKNITVCPEHSKGCRKVDREISRDLWLGRAVEERCIHYDRKEGD